MGLTGSELVISRKVALALLIVAVGSCVLVGIVTFYAGVAGLKDSELDPSTDCSASAEPEPNAEPEPEPASKKVTDVRLPRHLVPKKYTLSLTPFIIPNNFTIKGYVEVEMEAVEKGDNITLHVADMAIDNDTVIVVKKDDGTVGITSYKYDADREFYILMLDRSTVPGHTYTIKIHFIAKLNDNLKGFYRSSFKDKTSGEDEYIAVTQFQPTDARRAFPCFDEPGIKAKYVVSLGRRKEMSSISNMKIRVQGEEMKETDEYVWDHYDESVEMSTYLVAFVVSKFEYREADPRSNNVRFRIWSRSDAVEQTEYARDIGPRMLEFFENYFNVPFPLPKQDMIAIPDFGAGAMENWGLITYRETALLFKEGVSAASNKQRIAIVVSHELAHQWFGNLVTPSWWTDLWLNEGFASYVEYLGVDAIQPQLKLLEQFVVSDLQDVFRTDALESSHPISIPVKHPDEINEIFDRISYGKGASIIRMMDKFLTTDTFRKGLTNYLNELKFKAATQDDLWRHLTEQAHKDGTLPSNLKVKTIMDTWTLQMGFPYVTVERDYDGKTATLSQERFLLTTNPSKKDTHDYKWWIPITFATPAGDFNDTYNSIWMEEKEKTKVISGLPDKETAVIFNVQETGYYRVNYDITNWKLIVNQLDDNHQAIHVINRAQILDDALNLAKTGHLDYKTALSLTGYLHKEIDYIPWTSALTGISYIDKMLKRTPAYGEFKKYMLKLITPLYNRLGSTAQKSDEHLDILLRKKVVSWACKVEHPECVYQAIAKFDEWMERGNPDQDNPVDVNLKFQTYCNAIARGGEKAWDFAWERYNASNVATEKSTILSSLGCAKEVWLLNRYLQMSLTPGSGVRKQDGSRVISTVASNTVGRYLAFDFIRDKWETIVDYYGSASFTMPGIMKSVMKNRNTDYEINELKDFQKKNADDLRTATRAVKQAIEAAEANLDWMDRNYEDIFTWLKQQNQS